jgi:hypothetical protein
VPLEEFVERAVGEAESRALEPSLG